MTLEQIESAIAEIKGTNFGADQCHESTMRIALEALEEQLKMQQEGQIAKYR